jgi:hypothetical protein
VAAVSVVSAVKGAMSALDARRLKAQVRRGLRETERRQYRERQEERRRAEREARTKRSKDLALARELCAVNVASATEVANRRYKASVEALRQRRDATKREARAGCSAGRAEIKRAAADAITSSRRLRDEDRKFRADLKRIEARAKARERERRRASSTERRSERDEAVEVNIAPELQGVWRKVKGQIKATGRKSRLEAFEQYLEENPGARFEGGGGFASDDEYAREFYGR